MLPTNMTESQALEKKCVIVRIIEMEPNSSLPVNKRRKTEISSSNNEHIIIILIEVRPTTNHQI